MLSKQTTCLYLHLDLSAMTENEITYLYQYVGDRIRSKRIEQGISQESLASQLSLSRASVANIENGRQKISLHLLIDIIQIFSSEIQYFLPTFKNEQISLKREWKEQVKHKAKDKESQKKLTSFLENIIRDTEE